MKNRKLVTAAVLAVLLAAVIAALLLRNTGEVEDLADKTATVADAYADVQVITFAVPDICSIDEDRLLRFNEELAGDGYKYALRIKYLGYDGYTGLLENELKTGDTDVAFLGLGDSDGGNDIYALIKSGLVIELDGLIDSEAGRALYDAFPEKLWEAVRCDGHIRSIPSALVDDSGVYAAFNRNYVSDEAIEGWDGSIEGIYEILENCGENDGEAPRLEYLINGYSFDDMLGCEIKHGLVFDYDSLSVENPLESEKLTGYLRVLEKLKDAGYMDASVEYLDNPGMNSSDVRRTVEADDYAVALAYGETDEAFLKDNIAVKRVKPYIASRINGSIAISKNTENVDDVVNFLGLLYGSEKYGNILLYGMENTDYKITDGVVCNMDGSDMDDGYINKLCLNLFVNVKPVSGERYMNNRREMLWDFYDSASLSPFAGFEADTTDAGDISEDLDEFMSSLTGSTVDEALAAAKASFAADGIETYLDSVRGQWEVYHR